MKEVLLVVPDSGKSPSWGYRCKKGLEDLGHKTSVFNYRTLQLHRFKPTNTILNKLLVSKIEKKQPDIVLVLNGEKIQNKIIEKISKNGIKTVMWRWDDPFAENIAKYHKITNIIEYDNFFIFDKHYISKVKELGQKNTYYLPVGADTELYHEAIPLNKRKYNSSVAFMGSYYKERANFFNSLNNISFDVWGYGWQKNQKYLNKNVKIKKKIFDTRKKTRDIPKTAKLFNESRINLNIHHSQAKNGGLNLRAFEIPATNSFQISNFVKGTRDLFKKDELICFNNNNELKELISYYLENKEERNKITKKGFLRVKKDHTFKVRMKQMMDKIH